MNITPYGIPISLDPLQTPIEPVVAGGKNLVQLIVVIRRNTKQMKSITGSIYMKHDQALIFTADVAVVSPNREIKTVIR